MKRVARTGNVIVPEFVGFEVKVPDILSARCILPSLSYESLDLRSVLYFMLFFKWVL